MAFGGQTGIKRSGQEANGVQRIRTMLLLTAALILLAAGCQGKVSTIEPTATSIEFATRQAMPPTAVPPTATEVPPTQTPRPTNTPLPTATPSPDLAATARVESAQATQTAEAALATVEAAVQATREAQPSQTAYPTYTVEPSATPTDTPEPTVTPTIDLQGTRAANQTQQAALATQVAEAAAATVAAYTAVPSQTPLPSYTPYPTLTTVPSATPTDTPTVDLRGTRVASQREQATAAAEMQVAVAATVAAYTAVPSQTPLPSYTPYPTLTPVPSATPTVTPTIDLQGTRAANQTQQAALATQVAEAAAATVAAYTAVPSQTPLPSYTPYPTLTPVPSATPTVTPTIDLQGTRAANQTQQAALAAQVAEAAAATVAAYTAVPSQTPLPTYTPYPTLTVVPSATPTEIPPTATIVPSATLTPTPLPSLTWTPSVTLTPRPPTETPVPPTQVITLLPSPSGPTPDLFASATAVAPAQMTATEIITEATATAAANATALAISVTPSLAPHAATATAIVQEAQLQTAQPTPTLDFAATATQIVLNVTASAEAIQAAQQVTVTLPVGWYEDGIGPNVRYYIDGNARLYVYSGNAAYFAERWGIPEDTVDMAGAVDALAVYLGGTVSASPLANAIPVMLPAGDDMQGVVYLVMGDPWVIVSASAPVDTFETYRADVFEPAAQSVRVGVPGTLVETPTPSPVPISTINAAQATATKIIEDATSTAIVRLSATPTLTPSLTQTRRPTATYTPTPTYTPTTDFGATATAFVIDVTATAEALQSAPPVISLAVPEGWDAPVRFSGNAQYLTDDTAHIFVYSGNAAYFAERWGIPEDTVDMGGAVDALAAHVGGTVSASPLANAIPVMLPAGDDMQGVVYLAMGDPWVVVSASAPVDEFETYQADVFDPLVQSMAGPGEIPPVEATATPAPVEPSVTPVPVKATATPVPPKATATPEPDATPVTFEPYTNEAMGLSFDVPAGWAEYIDDSLNLPELGAVVVFFFANPAEVGMMEGAPDDPVIFIMRVDLTKLGSESEDIDSPDALLVEIFGFERDQVKPYTLESFPAARAVIYGETEDEPNGMIYALRLGETDWVVEALVVPQDENVLLLDETIMMPVVRSIQVIGVLNGMPEPVEVTPTTVFITATSAPVQISATPTGTPES
jgi:hypothetical protein